MGCINLNRANFEFKINRGQITRQKVTEKLNSIQVETANELDLFK